MDHNAYFSLRNATINGESPDKLKMKFYTISAPFNIIFKDIIFLDKKSYVDEKLTKELSRRIEFCEILINDFNFKINLNDQDDCGNTALHITVKNKNLEGTKYLISKGADVNVVNDSGEDAFLIACKYFTFKTQADFDTILCIINKSDLLGITDKYGDTYEGVLQRRLRIATNNKQYLYNLYQKLFSEKATDKELEKIVDRAGEEQLAIDIINEIKNEIWKIKIAYLEE
jgi:hypothetical protein